MTSPPEQSERVPDPEAFYDGLADTYHLLFPDWNHSIQRQGDVLSTLIQQHTGKPSAFVLDCTCGIGTQALGLAERGHHVVASDLSTAAVQRARREATHRGLNISFHVADIRTLRLAEGPFDAVLAADNALPHLLTQEDLQAAVRSIASHLHPDGIFLATLRDYDELLKRRPVMQPPSFTGDEDNRHFTHQVWEWRGDTYILHLYVSTRDAASEKGWTVQHFHTRYRALVRSDLNAALHHAGLHNIAWLGPSATSFYQPIVIARR